MDTSTKLWFLLGAGVSAGSPSNLPLWGEMAQDTMEFLYRTLEHKISATGGEGFRLAKEALELIKNEAYPEVVLECLCAAYGRTSVIGRLRALLNPPDRRPNICHQTIAQFCKQDRVQGILTTNFDTFMEQALQEEGVAFHVVADNNIKQEKTIPVIKAHGTIEDGSSLVFTRGEYYLGLSENLRNFLKSNMKGSTLVIAGYSGNDIDVFPFIRSLILENVFDTVHVVDLVPLKENRRFNELLNRIHYRQEAAEDFLCRLANVLPPTKPERRKRPLSAIVSNDDKYPAALFFGDSLLTLGIRYDLAFRIFFLTQDIVEEETGDLRQLCISQLAKSQALFDTGDNSGGEREYSAGRTMLHDLLNKSDLPKHQNILSEFGRSLASLELEGGVPHGASTSGFLSGMLMPTGPDRFDNTPNSIEFLYNALRWELRARIRACFAALAVAAGPNCPEQQRANMLATAGKLMQGFEKWDTYFTDSRTADELPILPIFYARYFRVFKSLILKNDKGVLQGLNECIAFSQRRGFYIGTSCCYFLKKMYGIALSETERRDYESLQKYCGVNEERMIASLHSSRGKPFELSINNYRPPIKEIRDASI